MGTTSRITPGTNFDRPIKPEVDSEDFSSANKKDSTGNTLTVDLELTRGCGRGCLKFLRVGSMERGLVRVVGYISNAACCSGYGCRHVRV